MLDRHSRATVAARMSEELEPTLRKKTLHTFCQHVFTQENHSHHSKRYLSNSETLVLLSFEEPLEDASYFEKLTADMAMLVPLSTRRK